MAKQRKSRIAKQRKRLNNLENASQLELSIGVPETQVSTCQVPAGAHSTIFHAAKAREVPTGAAAVYLVLNEASDWDTGWTRHLSYSEIAKRMGRGMSRRGMSRSTVIAHVQRLVDTGWIAETKQHGDNKGNTYRLVHHNCDPLDAPRDDKGLPKKCAMPRSTGSAYEKLANGDISYQSFLYWHLLKMLSDWTTGVVSLTYAQTREWLAFAGKTISNIKKELSRVGFFERLSGAFQAFECQLYPKPYPKRRRRRENRNPKSMKLIDGFYHSFNGLWRVSRETGQIQTKLEGSDRWRPANERELENTNKKIWKDFKVIIELACSPFMRRMRSEATA